MARCMLEVTLKAPIDPERQLPRVQTGAQLTGSVVVSVDEPVACHGLTLVFQLVRRDHHGGSEAHQHLEAARLFAGRWEPGEHRYAFAVTAPERPSYDGHIVSFEWVLVAAADIPWSADPSDRLPLRVEASPVESHRDIAYEIGDAEASGGASNADLLRRYGLGFVTLPGLGLGAGGAVHAVFELEQTPAIFAVGAAMGVVLMGIVLVRAKRRERDRLGPVLEVAIHRPQSGYRRDAPEPVARGVARRRAATAAVEHVYIGLRVVEQTAKVIRRSEGRTSYTPIRHKLWEREIRLEPTPDDAYSFELPLPEAGSMPFSIPQDERGRGVYWELTARVVRDDRPDDETARALIDVRPAPRGSR